MRKILFALTMVGVAACGQGIDSASLDGNQSIDTRVSRVVDIKITRCISEISPHLSGILYRGGLINM